MLLWLEIESCYVQRMMKSEPARERGADSDYAKIMEEQVATRVRFFKPAVWDIFTLWIG